MDLVEISQYWHYFLGGWIGFALLVFVGQLITVGLWATENAICICCSLLSILFSLLCGFLSTASFIMFVVSVVILIAQMFS